MLQIQDYKVEHLHTFQSEKIGIQWYYLVTICIDYHVMRYCIMADGEDVWQLTHDEDNPDADITEGDIEEAISMIADAFAESLTLCEDIEEAKEQCNESIESYNNGAYMQIELND